MARNIRFPLEMENGVEVRTLEELKENFSLEKVLSYLSDGKLETWLRDRYEDGLADAVAGLDKNDAGLNRKICDIFDVEYTQEDTADMESAVERNRRRELLGQYTDERKYYDVINQIAFEQDDVYDLLDDGETVIYLCGDKFSVPTGKKGIRYIGVNNPVVVINAKEKVDFDGMDISFENVRFDEKYQKILDALNPKEEGQPAQRHSSGSGHGSYTSNSYWNFMLSPKDKTAAKDLYDKLLNSGIAGLADEYISNL
ncbi:MAG: hypothetical protein NC433_18020 [Clostridiales bacterium]|nr:hypothetical protein [Clostridiales bacterium]